MDEPEQQSQNSLSGQERDRLLPGQALSALPHSTLCLADLIALVASIPISVRMTAKFLPTTPNSALCSRSITHCLVNIFP